MARTEVPLNDLTKPTWQHKDLTLLLLHPEGCAECDAVVKALRSSPSELRDPELSLRVVRGGEGDGMRQAVNAPMGAAVALVSDRFLELFAVLEVHGQDATSFVSDLASWAEAVARQCGECSRMQFD